MAPTLRPGDRVVGLDRVPSRGDVVVFDAPDGMVMVKRVVADAGSVVVVADATVSVDGIEVPTVLDVIGEGEWNVPDGHCFVLSDASDLTLADSRTFGPIRLDSVRSVVRWRYAPLRRVGRVR